MDQGITITCPLCLGARNSIFFHDKRRDYRRCDDCLLVFVPSGQHLSLADEKAIYDLHENDPNDIDYRQFLSRLSIPLTERLDNNTCGIDYGCGPGPALAAMLNEQGFNMEVFDPIYANQTNLLNRQYDFITCTEVVEHFRNPHAEFERLFAMLSRNGWLGIMTKQVIDTQGFATWHYKNDPTHISFFSKQTFQWLAEKYQCRVEFLHKDVVIFQVSK